MANRITPGSSTPSVEFYALRADVPVTLTSAEAGLAISWLRQLEGIPLAASYTALTLSDLGAINSAHSAGGLIVKNAATGLHRLDLPSTAAAAGADEVRLECSATDTDLVFVVPPIVLDAEVQSRASLSVQTLLDYDNAICVDPDGGTDDATFGEDGYGKRSAPCKTWANVASLLASSGFNKVRVIGSGNLLMTSMPVDDLTIALDPHCTIRTNGTVTTGSGSRLEVIGGADFLIGGTWTIGSAGVLRIRDCRNVTGTVAGSGDSRFEVENSEITGTLTLSNFGEHQVTKCWSIHTASGYPTIAVTTGHCTITDWEGGLTVNPTGTGHIHITGRSTDLTILGSSGSVELVGEIVYTNAGTGTLTVDASGVTAKESTLGTPTDGDVSTDIANLQAEFDAGVNVATVELTDATDYFTTMITTILAKVQRWFALIARSDGAAKADLSTEFNELNANFGTGAGTYDNELKALQASGNITSLGGSTQALTNLKNSSLAILSGVVATADSAANSETSFDTNLPQETENYYGDGSGGLVVAFISGTTNAFQTRRIVASVNSGASNTRITLEQALDDVPADADAFVLLGRITELN